eukprot:215630_1
MADDMTLNTLLEYTKEDILELINEINEDDSNQHRIPVIKKNKFAKIMAKYAVNDPSRLVILDKKERAAILKLSTRMKQLDSSIASVSETSGKIGAIVKQCEMNIDAVFEEAVNHLKERKKQLLNALHKIAHDKRNTLAKQADDLKHKLAKTEEIHKKMNVMIKTP